MKTFTQLTKELQESSKDGSWSKSVDDYAHQLGGEVQDHHKPITWKISPGTVSIRSSHAKFNIDRHMNLHGSAGNDHESIEIPANTPHLIVPKKEYDHIYTYHPAHGMVHIKVDKED